MNIGKTFFLESKLMAFQSDYGLRVSPGSHQQHILHSLQAII